MSKRTHCSGVSTDYQWYWNPNHVQIAIGGAPGHHTQPRNATGCDFKPIQQSPAELRCQDMIKVHNAEVKRNRDSEDHLQRALKRVRSERAQLREANNRLTAQLREARGRPPATDAAMRKRVLELIRIAHPDKSNNTDALDRTQLTQQLTNLLELL